VFPFPSAGANDSVQLSFLVTAVCVFVCVWCVCVCGELKHLEVMYLTEHRSYMLISLPHVREFPVLKISPKSDTIIHLFVVCLIAFSIDASFSFG